jgi:AI-2 transport protein TqsA
MPDGASLAEPAASVGLRTVVFSVALTLMLGWILYLGRGVFVPVISSVLAVYVITGLAGLLARLPLVGSLPNWVHYLIAALVIAAGLIELVTVFTANLVNIAARAPMFEAQLLGLIQGLAEKMGVEETLTWETVRRDALGQVNLQSVLRTGLSSAASVVSGLFLVLLNVAFMMMERQSFYAKVQRLFPEPERCDRLLSVVTDVNRRVGRYLAVKTLINVVLGLVSYVILALFGVEFAVFWAIVIAVLNYIPYIGSFIGVTFPGNRRRSRSAAQLGEIHQGVAAARPRPARRAVATIACIAAAISVSG